MKNFSIALVAIFGLLFSACQKDFPVDDQNQLQDVTFNIGTADKGLKNEFADCSLDADYVVIILNGETENPVQLPVFYVNEIMYTQAIKLSPGFYTINEFILYQEAGDPLLTTDDIMLSATPHTGSMYGDLVDYPLDFTFEVSAFTKIEVPISILCYEESEYEAFGFTWLRIELNKVNEGLFFGDLCSEDFLDYAGSLYGDYPKFDMPAIFEIELYLDVNNDGVFDASELQGTFNNYTDSDGNVIYSNNPESASVPPVSIVYVNRPGITDNFKLIINVFQQNPAGTDPAFIYLEEEEWFFTDEMDILTDAEGYTFGPGQDGIYDFIAGPCVVIDWDVDLEDPGPDCTACDKLASLTLVYNGTQAATIVVDDGAEIFNAVVQPNEEFTVFGSKAGNDFDKNDVEFFINNISDTKIHVSCSRLIGPGLTSGSFTVTDAVNVDGTHLCPVDGECNDCFGGVISMTLQYNGTTSAYVVFTDSDHRIYFEGTVNPGDFVRVDGTKADGKFEKNDVLVMVNGQQEAKIHVSCSKPVNPGLTFGPFTITEAYSRDGGLICPFVVDDNQLPNAETAYAFYDVAGTECFLNLPQLNANRWGWTNRFDASISGTYTLPIYAGAAQCDVSKGALVGELLVEIADSKVKKVTYVMYGSHVLYEAHLYIGEDILPMDNGSYTVAPGQYTYKGEGLDELSSFEFPDDILLNGEFYLIAHCVVK